MADTKYIAVKNFYGPNGMVRKGKEAVYNAKHVKKNLIVTEDEYKEMQSKQKKASRIAANAKTDTLSKLASKEVQEVAKIVASQVETAEAFSAEVEKAFGEAYDKIEAQDEAFEKLSTSTSEQIESLTKLVDILTVKVGALGEVVPVTLEETPTGGPEEILTNGPEETPTGGPEETKRTRRRK